jgi:hypothetical protein
MLTVVFWIQVLLSLYKPDPPVLSLQLRRTTVQLRTQLCKSCRFIYRFYSYYIYDACFF